MCGISGFRKLSGNIDNHDCIIMQRMLDDIKHRGPDDRGIKKNEDFKILLGHVRLSILDISRNGSQPMTSHCGKYEITYNGELYNFLDLKSKLDSETNINWKSQSDTEVLLNYVAQYGVEKTLEDAIGMFAFCIFDKVQKVMFLCRDRLGEKPLFYGKVNNYFWFGSSLHQLKRFPNFEKKIDRISLEHFLRHGYINAPRSIFKGISKVKPGTFITIDQNLAVTENKYWKPNLHSSTEKKLSINECIEKTEELLVQSIKRTVVSDVPIGSFLSGGIDSSVVTALMQANSSKKIKTFTMGVRYKGKNDSFYDESIFAKKIAKYLGTDHYEDFIDEQVLLDNLQKVNLYYDEPFADSSQLPSMSVAKLARKNVKVVLSGDGADEIFGGYTRYLHTYEDNKFIKTIHNVPNIFKPILGGVLTKLNKNFLNKLSSKASILPSNLGGKLEKLGYFLKNNKDDLEQFYDYGLAESQKNYSRLFNDQTNKFIAEKDFYNFKEHSNLDIKTRIMLKDLSTYLPGDILAKVDRATMAYSLESRTPYLDKDLIDFVIGLPIQCKINGLDTKVLLKKILSKYLPKELYNRKKQGFAIPLESWLRTELKEWAFDLLDSDALKNDEYLSDIEVKNTYHSFLNYGLKAELSWYLLSYISWKKHYFDE